MCHNPKTEAKGQQKSELHYYNDIGTFITKLLRSLSPSSRSDLNIQPPPVVEYVFQIRESHVAKKVIVGEMWLGESGPAREHH